MQALPGGLMASVEAEASLVAAMVETRRDTVAIAALNAPRQTVISGSAAEVRQLLEALAADGVRSRILSVSHAFHSSLMAPVLDDIEAAARRLPTSPARIPLVLNLTGALSDGSDLADPSYFRRHAREPVQFAATVEETPPPSTQELTVLRDLQIRTARAHGGEAAPHA